MSTPYQIRDRFRGFLPVVVDCETGGFNCATDGLLEIAGVILSLDPDGNMRRIETWRFHVQPFPGARLDPASLAVNGIDPHHPLRPALPERDALGRLFKEVRNALKESNCTRAILVGHNAAFDLGFLNAAVARTGIKRNPFHPFSCFDTATLGGVALGQTVLSKAVLASGMTWDKGSAHSARYDAEQTADLFCDICNQFKPIFESARRRIATLVEAGEGPDEAASELEPTPLEPEEG
ncbi:MAG: ribonuclease T [Pseudomonadota bacterium]